MSSEATEPVIIYFDFSWNQNVTILFQQNILLQQDLSDPNP